MAEFHSLLRLPKHRRLESQSSSGAPESPSFGPLPPEMTLQILTFVDAQDLRAVGAASRLFNTLAGDACKEQCENRGLISKTQAFEPTVYKQFLFGYSSAIGPEFFQKYFGKVDVPPVPNYLIPKVPIENHRLQFTPESIAITVDAGSLFRLQEPVGAGKEARLIEAHLVTEDSKIAPQGKREIKVPLTLNNAIFLFQKYLSKDLLPFSGVDPASWNEILLQNGDVGVGASHWSYQNKQFSLAALNMDDVNNHKIAVVSLVDRILFDLSPCVASGQIPQTGFQEITSTETRGQDDLLYQSAIKWDSKPPIFSLRLLSPISLNPTGFAVQVGDENPPPVNP